VSAHLPRRTVTFVVRIWAEYLEQSPPVWRGEIERVDSGEKAYVRQVNDVARFIATHALETSVPGDSDCHPGDHGD
jgi:hypothetical protein